jgi:hypothetical protein
MPSISRSVLAICLLTWSIACDGGSAETPPAAAVPAPDATATPAPTAKPTPAATPSPAPTPTAEDGSTGAEAEPAAPVVLENKTALIMGSSMVATGFGALLQRTLDEHPYVTCRREAKSATGLARPDFFDWMDVGKRQIALHDPDLVIILVGGNDGQDLQAVGSRKHVVFGSAEWAPGYRARVDEFLTMLTAEGAHVLWLGVPRTNTVKLEAKLEFIREIQRAAVEANGSATYLPLTPFLEGEGGELMHEAVVNGKYQELRGDDGLHLTMSGSRYLADKVVPEVLATIDMPPADEIPPQPAEADAPAEPAKADEPAADEGKTPAADDAATGP